MTRPIPCDACRALGCSCDGIRHTCPTCGHACTVHPSKENHDAHQAHSEEARQLHPSLLHGDEFDRIIAQLAAERTPSDPCARTDRRAVPRRARRVEGREVEPYHDIAGPSSLERLLLVASTMTFALWCAWWIWRGAR